MSNLTKELAKRDIIVWLEYMGITTEKGEPLDFYNHPYLVDIFKDFSPKQVWLKAAQLGLSTTAILKTFFIVSQKGFDVIYTMPSASDLKAFVGGKINRIIASNDKLMDLITGIDAIEQKRIGKGVIYYKGTQTERASISTSADLYVCDEMDHSDLQVVEHYQSRLQNSDYAWEWYFANPNTLKGGVHRKWLDSTQAYWFVRCPLCGHLQYMSFPESFHEKEEGNEDDFDRYTCKKCNGEIHADDIRQGQWVKKYKNANFSGYWMPLWINPKKSAHYILDKHRTTTKAHFYPFICGLPCPSEGGEISETLIFQNCNESKQERKGRVVIGCDSGNDKHYTVGDQNGIFKFGKAQKWAEIELLLNKYPNSVAVIDAMPDITATQDLMEKYKGRVFLCYYTNPKNNPNLIDWKKKEGYVHADRSGLFQMLVDELTEGAIVFEGLPLYWKPYGKHFNSTFKQIVPNKNKMEVVHWECLDGLDHWLHSLIYWRIGLNKVMTSGGELLGAKKNPMIEKGYQSTDTYIENILRK